VFEVGVDLVVLCSLQGGRMSGWDERDVSQGGEMRWIMETLVLVHSKTLEALGMLKLLHRIQVSLVVKLFS